jgi:putative NADH-flavin reductase
MQRSLPATSSHVVGDSEGVARRDVSALNLLVLGATGRTGRQIVAGALGQGHRVTALARDPAKLDVEHEHLRVQVGEVTDRTAVEQAVAGQNAVLCALGPRSPRELVRSTLMRDAIPLLVDSMARARVPRLILMSALGAGESARRAPAIPRLAFRTILRQVGRDKERAEDVVRSSELEWTIVYPPSLTNGPAARYRHAEDLELAGSPRISRADVAQFMLAQLSDGRYVRKGVIVAP